MKKINILLVIILLTILIIPSVALAAWWNPSNWNWNIFGWFSKPPTQIQKISSTQQNQTNQIAGWKTYKNSVFQFEVNYPSDWQILETNKTTSGEDFRVISPPINNLPAFIPQVVKCVVYYKVTQNQLSFVEDGYWYSQNFNNINDWDADAHRAQANNIHNSTDFNNFDAADTYCPFNFNTHSNFTKKIVGSMKFYNTVALTQTVNLSVIGQSNWKIYANNQYGFQIKIPNDFSVDSQYGWSGVHFRSAQNQESFQQGLADCKNTDHPGVCADADADDSSDLFFSGQNVNSNPQNNLIKVNDFFINGIVWEAFYPAYLDGGVKFYVYSLTKNGITYQLYSPNEQFLQQVLSTFKFVK